MANATVDNGVLGQLEVSSKTLAGGVELEGVELVTATEGGTRVDLAKAEDTPHSSGDFGLMALGVRKDIAAAIASNDGDYTPWTSDALGRIHVNVGAGPAANRQTDSVGAAHMTDVIMIDDVPVVPKFKSITIPLSSTDLDVVAAVASKKIRVLAFSCQCGATATDLTLESGTGTRIHKVPAGANGGQILGYNPLGWFETAAGSALKATTGAGSATEITLTYIEV